MVHLKRDRHMPCVVGQQCCGLRTSKKGRHYNRPGRFQRYTTTRSPPILGLSLTLRHTIIYRKIIRHNILCHLLILYLLLRLIKHSLLLHPIISLKSLIRIPNILMRLCRINHLGWVIHLWLWTRPLFSTYPQVPTSPDLWNVQVFNLHLLSSAICHNKFTFVHPTLSNTPLLRILLPSLIYTKTD